MTSIAVVFTIGLAVGFAVGYAVRAAISSRHRPSRNEAALPSIGVGRTFFVASSLGAVSLSPGWRRRQTA
jgi:NhaP-type Na+/H+ or K+/H+ antiporter